jgi:hypothetical protein
VAAAGAGPTARGAVASEGPSGGGPGGPGGRSRPWLVPALAVGGLLLALVVVLALALGGGDPDPVADTTTSRTTADAGDEPSGESTTEETPPPTTEQAAPPATTAPDAAPAADEVAVQGGGTVAAGAATRDPAAGQPLAGTGVPADYVAPDGSWRTLVARPGDGWEVPRRIERGSALARMRQEGPGGRLILVDHTPRQAAAFETSNVLETRTITGTRLGDATGYRFSDARIGSIPECSRLQCVDVPLNQSDKGPGWGVLVAAPTAEEAWATVERVARATGP